PLFGYAHFNNATNYNEERAHRCVEFNKSVLRYLIDTSSIETVVIGSMFSALTLGHPWKAVAYGHGKEFKAVDITDEMSSRVLSKTVSALRDAGKRVVIFAPPPSGRA